MLSFNVNVIEICKTSIKTICSFKEAMEISNKARKINYFIILFCQLLIIVRSHATSVVKLLQKRWKRSRRGHSDS